MNSPQPPPPPGMPPPLPRDTRTLRERFADTHRESVAATWRGPVILLGAFVSSSLVLLWRGTHWCYIRTKQQCGY